MNSPPRAPQAKLCAACCLTPLTWTGKFWASHRGHHPWLLDESGGAAPVWRSVHAYVEAMVYRAAGPDALTDIERARRGAREWEALAAQRDAKGTLTICQSGPGCRFGPDCHYIHLPGVDLCRGGWLCGDCGALVATGRAQEGLEAPKHQCRLGVRHHCPGCGLSQYTEQAICGRRGVHRGDELCPPRTAQFATAREAERVVRCVVPSAGITTRCDQKVRLLLRVRLAWAPDIVTSVLSFVSPPCPRNCGGFCCVCVSGHFAHTDAEADAADAAGVVVTRVPPGACAECRRAWVGSAVSAPPSAAQRARFFYDPRVVACRHP